MKKVYEYLYGKGMGLTDDSPIPKDGNLMVLAINSMRDKGDWDTFKVFSGTVFLNSVPEIRPFLAWFFGDPAKFFELFEEVLDKKIIGG